MRREMSLHLHRTICSDLSLGANRPLTRRSAEPGLKTVPNGQPTDDRPGVNAVLFMMSFSAARMTPHSQISPPATRS